MANTTTQLVFTNDIITTCIIKTNSDDSVGEKDFRGQTVTVKIRHIFTKDDSFNNSLVKN